LDQAVWHAAIRLREAGLDIPQAEARRLIAASLQIDSVRLIADAGRSLDGDELARIDAALARREQAEPLSRIVGRREFFGREFIVSPATLDPRPDTEVLIELTLACLAMTGRRDRPVRLLDVGTGTGCVALTLLSEWSAATALATDICPDALKIARLNAERLGLRDRITFELRSALEGLDEQFDAVVSNPPYIPSHEISGLERAVRDYDPRMSLDGGADGLDVYRDLAKGMARVSPWGFGAFELGAGQLDAVTRIFADHGHERPVNRLDLNGHTRCVAFLQHSSWSN